MKINLSNGQSLHLPLTCPITHNECKDYKCLRQEFKTQPAIVFCNKFDKNLVGVMREDQGMSCLEPINTIDIG